LLTIWETFGPDPEPSRTAIGPAHVVDFAAKTILEREEKISIVFAV